MLLALVGCKPVRQEYRGKKVVNIYMPADIQSMDPIYITAVNDSQASAQVFETLLEYDYVKRPYALRPLLVKSMPKALNKGSSYEFELKPGIHFHDHPCFPGGKGRELVAKDVKYSILRMANVANKPRGWWVYKGHIKGLDRYRRNQARLIKQKKKFNYDGKVEGIELLGKYKFRIHLNKPFPQFLYLMAFQKTAIAPREIVEGCKTGNAKGMKFQDHPIGTGPFLFKKRRQGLRITFVKNPKYKHSHYPKTGFSKQMKARGLDKDAGKQLPFADILEVHIFREYQPAYLKFRTNDLDFLVVGREFWKRTFDKKINLKTGKSTVSLKPYLKKQGIGAFWYQRLLFSYIGINFKDKLLGGYGARSRYLRRALWHAIDWHEINQRFSDGRLKIFRGSIPPGMAGAIDMDTRANLDKAREYLKKAGYPGGRGLPPITLSTTKSGIMEQRNEVIARQFARIGVQLRTDLSTWPQLLAKVRSGQAQMFQTGWVADYPDPETFLMIFFGGNANGGANGTNFQHPEFDRLYKKIRTMFPSKERAAIYKRMNQILIDEAVFLGSLTAVSYYMTSKRLRNFLLTDMGSSFWKYWNVPVTK